MPKRVMEVEWPEGTELSKSQKKNGAYSPLARDGANNIAAHATLREIEEDAEEESYVAPIDTPAEPATSTAEDVLALVNTLIETADVWVPVVLRGIELARSVRRRAWARWPWTIVRTREVPERALSAEVAAVVEVATADSSAALAVAPDDARHAMSRDEAEQRLLVALVTRAISDDQVRVLLNARIEDADGYEGVGIEQFTPQEMEDLVTLMLEENPTLLNDLLQQIRDGRSADFARLQPSHHLDEPLPPAIGK